MGEFGRATTVKASGYDRVTVADCRLRCQEVRPLLFDFNGVMPVGELITQAVFNMAVPFCVAMADPSIPASRRSAQIVITAAWPGEAWIRCQVTTDQGKRYSQQVRVAVYGPGPIYGDQEPVGGPFELIATAP